MTMNSRDVLERVAGVTAERLENWIAQGWVDPARGESDFEFEEIDVARVDLIRQLRDELAIDRESMPVVLSLLDQVYSLRRELRCVLRALEEQPGEVREQIVASVRVYRE